MVLGTSDVVSEQVVRDLRAASPKAIVERVGGATRFDPMLAVARRMKAIEPARPVGTAVLVSGWNWPDAAAAAPLAAANGWPILLADGDRPRWQVENALRENGVGRVVVAGGTDVVGPSVIAHLATMGSAAPTETVRLEGPDRYGTAAAVAAWGLDRHGLVADRALLASGGSYADALSAATLGARGRAPLYLVKPGELSTPTQAALEAASPRITQLWGIGGTGVLTPSVWTMARSTADVP
jgi:putative cell wall-binding protein